jgi:hypothetical protein
MKRIIFTLQLISALKFFIIGALLNPMHIHATIFIITGTANILLYGYELSLLRKLKAANSSNPNS